MIKYSKVIAGNTDLLSAQAFVFSKPGEDFVNEYLILLISAQGDDVFNKIRQEAFLIEQNFFENSSSSSPQDRLLQTEKFIFDKLKTLSQINLSLNFIQDEVLYLHHQGTHLTFLKRDGKISLLNGEGLVSGHLVAGDRILFMTNYLDHPWDEKNTTPFFNSSLEDLEAEVNGLLENIHYKDPLALILLDFAPSLLEQPVKEPVFLKRENPLKKLRLPNFLRQKKILIILGVIALVSILAILGTFFLFGQMSRSTQNNFNVYLNSAQKKYQEADSLKENSSQEAQNKLSEAEKDLQKALKIKPQDQQAKELENKLQVLEGEVKKAYQITDWPVFLSLDLVKAGFNPQNMSFSVDKLLLFDTTQQSLISIDVNKKTNQILAGGPNLGQAKFASIHSENAFVFSDAQGIIRIETSNLKLTKIVPPDSEWGQITDIFAFAGNVYLLDNIKNQIWKYVPIPTGYSQKFTYLNEGVTPDFSGAKKLRIDYSVYVLKTGPEVLRFTGGASDFFSPTNLEQNLGEINNIYVGKDGERVYLLDSANSRLVVLKNNGEYFAQYIGDKFKTATDLVVDEEAKKIYLLEGGKIYQLELR